MVSFASNSTVTLLPTLAQSVFEWSEKMVTGSKTGGDLSYSTDKPLVVPSIA